MAELEFTTTDEDDSSVADDLEIELDEVALDDHAERIWIEDVRELQLTMSVLLTRLWGLSKDPDAAVPGTAIAFGFDPDEGKFFTLGVTGVDGKHDDDEDTSDE